VLTVQRLEVGGDHAVEHLRGEETVLGAAELALVFAREAQRVVAPALFEPFFY
jgi:hypothetical protein